MKLATVTIKTTKVGSTIIKSNVTPPELMYLVASHKVQAGGNPLLKLEEQSDEERDTLDELGRLKSIYPLKAISALFPGIPPKFPESFDDATKWGLHAIIPTSRLFTHDLATSSLVEA